MKPRLVILGGGGHAKVVIETARAQGTFEIIGYLDRAGSPSELLGVPYLGTDEELEELRAAAFPAIGDNVIRARLGRRIGELKLELPAIVSPYAHVSPSARLGDGVLVVAGAVINADTRIAGCAIVNTRAGIDHDCDVGYACHIAPGSVLGGTVKIGDGALIGIGSTVLPGLTIGAGAIVGGGSVVVRNIAAGATAYGNPARTDKEG